MEQKNEILDELQEIRREIEKEYNKFRSMSEMWDERANGIGTALEIIDNHIKRYNDDTR